MPVSLITASYDHRVVFWDLAGTARRTLQFAESQVNCLALSPDKSKLAVGGHGCIRLYDASPNATPQNTAAVGVTEASMLSGNITSMFFLDILTVKGARPGEDEPKSKTRVITNDYTLLATSEDGSIKIFTIRMGTAGATGQGSQQQQQQQPQMTFTLKHEVLTKVPITAATLFPNQQLLITGTQLGRVSVWHLPAIFGLAGSLSTTGSSAGPAEVIDESQLHSASSVTGGALKPAGAKPIQELALEADPTSVRSIAVSAVGNFISVATNIGRIHFFAFCRGESAMAFEPSALKSLRPIRPVRNSNPHFNQSLNPFALEEFTFTVAHEKYVLKTAIAPNGRYIVTASADYTIGMFGVPEYLASGKFIVFSDIYTHAPHSQASSESDLTPLPEEDPQALQFQGGVAAGIEDPRLRFPLRRTFLGHQRWVWDCCISPCSCYILSASSDHTGRLWKVDGDLSTASPQPLSVERLASEYSSPSPIPPPTVVNTSIAVYNYHNKAVNCCLLDIEA